MKDAAVGIPVYFLGIFGLAYVTQAFNGMDAVTPARLLLAFCFSLAAAWGIWLRWQWAPEQRRKRQTEVIEALDERTEHQG